MRIQVVGVSARADASADWGVWNRLTARALSARAHWRLRSRGLDRRTAIASANGERQPVGDRAQPQAAGSGATASGNPHNRSAPAPGLGAFDQFYTCHEQPLYGYLRRLLPSREIAVEIAQETFFRAWRHFDVLSSYERPEAWLYRVATNLAISHLRRRRLLSFSPLSAPSRADAAGQTSGADLIASPLDMEGQAVERDTIAGALRRLPARQRAALLLAVQGLTTDEIATALGASPDNARKILSRARERFRSLYDEAQRAAV